MTFDLLHYRRQGEPQRRENELNSRKRARGLFTAVTVCPTLAAPSPGLQPRRGSPGWSMAAVLAFCSAPGPCHARGVGDLGAAAWSSSGCWKPGGMSASPAAGAYPPPGSRTTVPRSSGWRSLVVGPWLAPPPCSMSLLGGDGRYPCTTRSARRPRQLGKPQQQQQQQWGPLSGMRAALRRRRPAAGATPAVSPGAVEGAGLGHAGIVLLPPLGWLPAAVSGLLRGPVVESAVASAPAAAEPVLAAGRSMWDLGGRSVPLLHVSIFTS